MFQRLKGAIDSRIAEEQARQREITRSQAQSARDSRIDRRNLPPQRGPDPNEFDGALAAMGDGETPVGSEAGSGSAGEGSDGRRSSTQAQSPDTQQTTANRAELPTNVRVKLRRLDKIESKYKELLIAYRSSHDRVLCIEPFEASLRENTPLTSIDDPGAFTEYVNQMSLKSDMVLAELKRVTSERDDYKKRLAQTEMAPSEGRNQPTPSRRNLTDPSHTRSGSLATDRKEEGSTSASPSITSRAQAVLPGLNIFSFNDKEESTQANAESEEFFSYEGEIPRLHSELQQREEEVSALQDEVKTLKENLDKARASSQGAVTNLEYTNQQLSALRDAKANHNSDLHTAEQRFSELSSKLQTYEAEFERSKTSVEKLHADLAAKDQEIERLRNESSTPPGTDNKHTDAIEKLEKEKAKTERRYQILQGIVDTLKSQTKNAESTLSELQHTITVQNAEKEGLQNICNFLDAGFAGKEDWLKAKAQLLDGKEANFDQLMGGSNLHTRPPSPSALSTASTPSSSPSNNHGNKKKIQKKNRGKNAADKEEKANTVAPEIANVTDSIQVSELEQEVKKLIGQLAEKEQTIDRLHGKLKDQEGLCEEIETLRDDLLHVGEGHVDAKDQAKALATEKKELESKIADLEKAIADARANASRHDQAEEAQAKLTAEIDELKTRDDHRQRDLDAAQKLAASRFKELSDLKEKWQKLQSEVKSLREDSKQLRAVKEQLNSKTDELKRLEKRHEDVSSDMKNLQMRIGSQDLEMKSLNQRLTHEATLRNKSDHALSVARSDMQYSEQQRQEAIECNEQTKQDLSKTNEFLHKCQHRMAELDEELGKSSAEVNKLKEEIRASAALHGSSTQLANEMRDQSRELSIQLKEYRERSEGLEEEVNRTHRLLLERTHDTEVVRGLLASVEMQTETKIRDFRERLNTATEERDCAEDEVSNVRRKKGREIEELRTTIRDLEKKIRLSEEDQAEIELASKEWKKRREMAESESERVRLELSTVNQAMAELREALFESEKLVQRLEKDRNDLRRSLDDVTSRCNKLQTMPAKSLSDESRTRHPTNTERRQFKPSVDYGQSRPSPGSPSNGTTSPLPLDHIYLKNILLQFMEQKDKNLQKQLIPVLSMLLKFDPTDEQKWMSAVMSK